MKIMKKMVIRMNKKLIVSTAQRYYEAAKGLNTDGEVYSQAEKNLFMDEVVNHTQSALAASLRLLNRAQYYLDDRSWIARDIQLEIRDFVSKFNIEL
jgi:hypothetical protein